MAYATAKDLLTEQQLASGLAALANWTQTGASIARSIELVSFPAAIALVTSVADAAERADHHPDIDIRWRTVLFTLSTHSAGGLTHLDLALAGEIDALAATAATGTA